MKTAKAIRKANCVIYLICDHLIGKDHTHIHRCAVGFVFMGVGVAISQSSEALPFARAVGEGFGYLIHGFGTLPYVEGLGPFVSWLQRNKS